MTRAKVILRIDASCIESKRNSSAASFIVRTSEASLHETQLLLLRRTRSKGNVNWKFLVSRPAINIRTPLWLPIIRSDIVGGSR